jgi:16S rRNA (cytidine1402-2'-O)-methyltransferase
VCRELTKRHEEVALGTVSELAERFGEPVRGEVTLVLGAAPPVAASAEEAAAAVTELVEAGVPRRQAAELVSRLTGASRNALYRRSL